MQRYVLSHSEDIFTKTIKSDDDIKIGKSEYLMEDTHIILYTIRIMLEYGIVVRFSFRFMDIPSYLVASFLR